MTVTIDNKPILVPDAVRRKAGLRRGDRIEFKVSGRSITIVPAEPAEDDWSDERITKLAKAAKQNPMSPRELAAEMASLARYGARQAKKLGVRERDIVRIIHESRRRRPS